MSSKAGQLASKPQKQVLIVDDEESLAFFLRESLLEIDAEWEVDTAGTGEEAVIKINRNSYRLVIADLRMPGLNGLELLQMVRVLEPNTRVILMTAYGSDQVEKEARRLNVYRYVTKPFDMEDMKRWAQEAVEESRLAEKRAARAADTGPTALATPAATATAAAGPSADQQNEIIKHLARVRFRLNAQYVAVMQATGDIMAEAGRQPDVPLGPVASALGAALHGLSRSMETLFEQSERAVLLHTDARYRFYATAVGENAVFVILFDRTVAEPTSQMVLGQVQRMASEAHALLTRNDALAKGVSSAVARAAPWDEAITEEEADESSGRVAASGSQSLSLDEARARGLIDDETLRRLLGDQDNVSS